MLKKICLTVLCVFILYGVAHGAAPFESYLAAVQDVNLDKKDDQQKAAKALLLYMQKALKADPLALGGLLDEEFLLNGKLTRKKTVARKLEQVFTPSLVKAMLESDAQEDMLIRGGAEFGFAAGGLWVNFTDDKPQKPVIFAVVNK